MVSERAMRKRFDRGGPATGLSLVPVVLFDQPALRAKCALATLAHQGASREAKRAPFRAMVPHASMNLGSHHQR